MEKIYLHWKVCFFTEAMLVILLFAALWISLKNRKRHAEMKFFPFYIAFLLIVFISLYANIYSEKIWNYSITTFNFHHYIDYISTLFELFVFIHFFVHVISNRWFKKFIIFIAILFTIYYLAELVYDDRFTRSISKTTQSRVYTIQSLVLLIPCIRYFYELFKHPPILNLKQEPSFWIVTGLSFFIISTLPYSLIENYLRKNHLYLMTALYSVFYIFYIILISMIIRAYTCNPKKSI